MKDIYCIMPGKPVRSGCYRFGDDIYFCASYRGSTDCGVCLFDKRQRKIIRFDDSFRHGNVFSAIIKNVPDTVKTYMLYENGNLFCDPYAVHIIGLDKFGINVRECDTRCEICEDNHQYDWGNDHQLHIPFENSIIYCLNVRGYTMSPSSGIPKQIRGTYKGLEEKIPYLRELGITTIELMPSYELKTLAKTDHTSEALEKNRNVKNNAILSHNGSLRPFEIEKELPNLWGFGQGSYFAPRSAYSSDKDNPGIELRNMIKKFHENGIEVTMQFFFPEGTPHFYMLEAIRYWVLEYHIDGVHFKGMNIPVEMISSDSLLSETKIMNDNFNYNAIYGINHKSPKIRNLAECRDSFEYISRAFLKGDDNSVNPFLTASVANGLDHAVINYICNYDGLRLVDLVAYEHKHNDDNGENNTDGNDVNCSWNCGIEGKTRKHAISLLRNKQMKNIMTMLFMAQGTPLLFGGDEFGNSQAGNNNPYCQDNEVGWISWKAMEKNQDILEYTRFLISLRMRHLFLHEKYPLRLMDYKSCGYPDLSYHGKEAWIPDLSGCSHSVALLFSGFYEKKVNSFIYIVYNMHWKKNVFALPRLPEGMSWHLIADTTKQQEDVIASASSIECEARSVCIFEGTGAFDIKEKNKDKKSTNISIRQEQVINTDKE